MSDINPAAMVTPHRKSHIRFDVPDQALIQPPYSLIRMGNEMARSPDAVVFQVRYLQNIGWELEPYQVNLAFKRERSEAAGGNMLPSTGLLTVADSHVEVPLFAKPTDLNGSDPSWYDSNVVTTGDVFIQKRVSGTDSMEQRLTADQASYPSSPDPDGDNVKMDRVAVGTENHDGKPFIFSFIAPTNIVNIPHRFKNVLFNGPPGSGATWKGTGRYQLGFTGGGRCVLEELIIFEGETEAIWRPTYDFHYAPAYSVGGQAHRVEIRCIAPGQLNYAPYGAIVFDVQVDSKSSYTGGPGLMAASTTKKPGRTAQSTFILTRTKARTVGDPPAMQSVPIRVDSRRDQRIPFQVTKLVYRTLGHLIDDPFALDFWPSANLVLQVNTLGIVPSGTSITARLFLADDDSEIAASFTDVYRSEFTIEPRTRHFYVRFDFEGTEETTPILEGYQVVMGGYIDLIEPGEFEPEVEGLNPGSLMSVSITGAEADPSHESMRLNLEDLTANMTRLSVRGRMLAQLETEYDPEDDTKRCVLFRGHIVDNKGTNKGHGVEEGLWPDRNWKSYDLTFMGVWKRLSESLSSVRFDWHGPDPSAPVGPDGIQPPYRATDAIDAMLGWCGFPPSMRNIPPSDIRLYPSTTNDLFIEPLANLCDYIIRIAHDYLGMWLTYDPNAGDYGKWSLLSSPTAPYDIKAAFVDEGPENKLAHCLESYPTDPPTAFILKGTLSPETRALEANRLVVTGTGILAGAPPDLKLLTQVLYNFRSCNFFQLDESHPNYPDPDHPDYIGYDVPLYVVDPTLQTPDAVNIVARRIFNVACLSTRIISFMAPLLLIDHETEEGKKRPLRFYDPVTVTRFGVDTTWLVRNVNPVYEKDSMQMASYELEAPREPFLLPSP
jgi:hypothetical protein